MDLYYGMGESANGSDLYYWEQYKHNNTHDNLIYYGKEWVNQQMDSIERTDPIEGI